MAIKLLVRYADGKEPAKVSYVFEQDRIRIGRAPENHITVRGKLGEVSKAHALVEHFRGNYFLVDVSSRNQTTLGGRRVKPREMSPLKVGDEVRIGPLVYINVVAVGDIAACNAAADPDLPAPRAVPRAVPTHRGEPSTRAVRVDSAPVSPPDHYAVVEEPAGGRKPPTASLPPRPSSGEHALPPGPVEAAPAAQPQVVYSGGHPLQKKCHEILQGLSDHLLGPGELYTQEDVELFGKLIETVLDSSLEGLAAALRGRAEFEGQFDAHVTMVFSRQSNPLKTSRSGKEAEMHLLDWREARKPDLVKRWVEESFRDLQQHQMALLGGFQKAIDAIVARLQPDRLAEEAKAEEEGGGLSRILSKRSPGERSWEKFRKEFAAMFADSTRLFNELIYPNIQRGYLAAHEEGRMTGMGPAKPDPMSPAKPDPMSPAKPDPMSPAKPGPAAAEPPDGPILTPAETGTLDAAAMRERPAPESPQEGASAEEEAFVTMDHPGADVHDSGPPPEPSNGEDEQQNSGD